MALPPASMLEARISCLLNNSQTLVEGEDGKHIFVNIDQFAQTPQPERSKVMVAAMEQLRNIEQSRGATLTVNTSMSALNDAMLSQIDHPITLEHIDAIRDCTAHFMMVAKEKWGSGFIQDTFPRYEMQRFPAVVRYGNVELRVVENYLRDRANLERVLLEVYAAIDDESAMYVRGKPSTHLAANDVEWNLRALMTNAGFYLPRNESSGWAVLQDWAERYIAALANYPLATFTPAFPFHFANQKILRSLYGGAPQYIQHPSAFQVYEQLAGKRVLFASPLAHLASEQYRSGRLWSLYKDRTIPRFELLTIPTWISTWPNRPHSDWSDTFKRLCRALDDFAAKNIFDVFICSCGCYGLPLSDYVRKTFNCSILYVGNISHAFFGIKQAATREFFKDLQNEDAWVLGDLGRYANMNRIDGGRYV